MLLASVALWRSESHRSIMHCAKAFLLIKFMFCLLLCLMCFYPWTLRSTRLSTLSIAFNFFLHPSQASPSIYSNPSIIPALEEARASFLVVFWDLWSLGAVPKLPLLTCKLMLLHEKFSELKQSAGPLILLPWVLLWEVQRSPEASTWLYCILLP